MQKTEDFRKDKRTNVVTSTNPDYYIEILQQRKRDQEMAELNNRISYLENKLRTLEDLIRSRLNG